MFIESKEFEKLKSRDIVPFSCKICGNIFYRPKHTVQDILKGNSKRKLLTCSKTCQFEHLKKRKKLICEQCKIKFERILSHCKGKHNFCSSSCAAKYNNTHKTTGYRRSKLEKWIEKQLIIKYPRLQINYNKTDAINGELDIYIPSLKLAFELNGIFHYEPIYSKEQFNNVQNNDKRKFQACLERGIELCILDVSSQKYFKDKTSIKYLKIIDDIIKEHLNGAVVGI